MYAYKIETLVNIVEIAGETLNDASFYETIIPICLGKAEEAQGMEQGGN